MESVTVLRGVVYRHIQQPRQMGAVACPDCGRAEVCFHSFRTRTVEHLEFSKVLCIDEVYDRVAGKRQPIFTCVDPIAGITIRIPIEKVDAENLASAMEQVRALGADPKVIVSDLWAAYPEALQKVWPGAERQLCWFHVQQWVTRQLARLLKEHAETLPEAQRKRLNRLRFRLLASPEKQARFKERERAELAEAWGLIAGTMVEEAIKLRNDLR